MVAYQAESDLPALIRTHYTRTDDEGRTVIQSALMTSGDIEVADNELRVILKSLGFPHRTKAIRALCAKLNTTNTNFPGSELHLVCNVKEHGHFRTNTLCQEF